MAARYALFVLFLVGCGSTVAPPPAASRVVKDCAEREVTIPNKPLRVVSLAPATTEILFAVGAGDTVVGVTEFCNYPVEAKSRTKIGGFSPKTINLEVLASLKPDVVFAAPGEQGPMIDAITRLGIPVVGVEARSFTEVMRAIRVVGETMNKTTEAETLVKTLEGRIAKVKAKSGVKKLRVFYLLNETPLMTAGPGTFVGELITTAGGENTFADAKTLYPTINEEELLRRNPEVIVIPQGVGLQPDVQKLFAKPVWKALDAVKANRVVWINEDAASRAGPRLADALEELAGKLLN